MESGQAKREDPFDWLPGYVKWHIGSPATQSGMSLSDTERSRPVLAIDFWSVFLPW